MAILNEKDPAVDLEKLRKNFPSYIYSENNRELAKDGILLTENLESLSEKPLANTNMANSATQKEIQRSTDRDLSFNQEGNQAKLQKASSSKEEFGNEFEKNNLKEKHSQRTLKKENKRDKNELSKKKQPRHLNINHDEDNEEDYDDQRVEVKGKCCLDCFCLIGFMRSQDQITKRVKQENEALNANSDKRDSLINTGWKIAETSSADGKLLNQSTGPLEPKQETIMSNSLTNPNTNMGANTNPGSLGTSSIPLNYSQVMQSQITNSQLQQLNLRGIQNDNQSQNLRDGYSMQVTPQNDPRMFSSMPSNISGPGFYPNTSPFPNMAYSQMNYNMRFGDPQFNQNISGSYINSTGMTGPIPQNIQNMLPIQPSVQFQGGVSTSFNPHFQTFINQPNSSQLLSNQTLPNNSSQFSNIVNPFISSQTQQHGAPLQVINTVKLSDLSTR